MCKSASRIHSLGLSIACCLFGCATSVFAGPCPESFSYVDLGQIDANGGMVPGGATFRVTMDGQTLLAKTPSCRRFSNEAAPLVDDLGDLIPLVATFAYSPTIIASNLGSFGVTRVAGQAARLTTMNEPMVASARSDPTIDQTTGNGFVCYSRAYSSFPSAICEVNNPFDVTKPVYMSCDDGNCDITGIFISSDLIASTSWDGDYSSPMAVGLSAVGVVSDIHLFLVGQMIE